MLTKMTRVQARAKSEHFMPYYLLPFTANYYVHSDNTKVGLIIQKLASDGLKGVTGATAHSSSQEDPEH